MGRYASYYRGMLFIYPCSLPITVGSLLLGRCQMAYRARAASLSRSGILRYSATSGRISMPPTSPAQAYFLCSSSYTVSQLWPHIVAFHISSLSNVVHGLQAWTWRCYMAEFINPIQESWIVQWRYKYCPAQDVNMSHLLQQVQLAFPACSQSPILVAYVTQIAGWGRESFALQQCNLSAWKLLHIVPQRQPLATACKQRLKIMRWIDSWQSFCLCRMVQWLAWYFWTPRKPVHAS